jgi:DNA-binding NarL/FixJ family response regulator
MQEHQQTLMKWAKRREKIYDMHVKGMSYHEIAQSVGLTASRIGQIVQAERLRRHRNGTGQES